MAPGIDFPLGLRCLVISKTSAQIFPHAWQAGPQTISIATTNAGNGRWRDGSDLRAGRNPIAARPDPMSAPA